MPDWIEQARQRIDEDKEREKKDIEALKLKRDIIADQAPSLFEAVKNAVIADIEKFNRVFPLYNQKLSDLQMIGPKKFQVRRAYDPSFRLVVEIKDSPLEICYSIETPNIVDGKTYIAYSDKFSFRLQTSTETVSLVKRHEARTPEDVSQELLMPALPGQF
jgi:hypothetical protein